MWLFILFFGVGDLYAAEYISSESPVVNEFWDPTQSYERLVAPSIEPVAQEFRGAYSILDGPTASPLRSGTLQLGFSRDPIFDDVGTWVGAMVLRYGLWDGLTMGVLAGMASISGTGVSPGLEVKCRFWKSETWQWALSVLLSKEVLESSYAQSIQSATLSATYSVEPASYVHLMARIVGASYSYSYSDYYYHYDYGQRDSETIFQVSLAWERHIALKEALSFSISPFFQAGSYSYSAYGLKFGAGYSRDLGDWGGVSVGIKPGLAQSNGSFAGPSLTLGFGLEAFMYL